MGKVNFSKIDELLSSSLFKMKVEEWHKLAKITQQVGKPEMRTFVARAAAATTKDRLDKEALIYGLKQAIRKYNKDQKDKFYEFIGIKPEELKELMQHPTEISPEDWKCLQVVRQKVKEFHFLERENYPEKNDENLVQNERKKHINKRFNVREKWLPL